MESKLSKQMLKIEIVKKKKKNHANPKFEFLLSLPITSLNCGLKMCTYPTSSIGQAGSEGLG